MEHVKKIIVNILLVPKYLRVAIILKDPRKVGATSSEDNRENLFIRY